MRNTLLLLTIFAITSCSHKIKMADKDSLYPPVFQKVLEAHGGLAKWNSMQTFQFTKGTGEDAEVHTTDLKSRKTKIEKEEAYTLGHDGQHVWVSPDREAFSGKSPRFYHNLHFYFAAIPFVFADPGVTLTDMGMQQSMGKDYHLVKATFGENVGDAPEDQYIMYINPATSIVEFINYSVTFYDKSKATQYNALVYDWKKVDGLLVPEKYTGYVWENGELGKQRYEAVFPKASYMKNKMDESFYAAPAGSYLE